MSFSNRISQTLHEEHQATVALVERLENLLTRQRHSGPPDVNDYGTAQLLADLSARVEAEVLRHFAFEEEKVFSFLEAAGDAAIGEHLTSEHQAMRPLGIWLAALARTAASQGFDAAGWNEFRRLGLDLCERLPAHVQKEEMALLPLLEEAMDAETEARLYQEYVENAESSVMTSTTAGASGRARSLRVDDLERVIAIDRAHTGHARRRFFEKRFDAAKAHPDDFVLVGVDEGKSLAGYAFAHLLHGEFGREQASATLDAVGVAPDSRDHGIGQVLIQGLVEVLRGKGVRALQSQADWTNHGLLRFFDAAGFELAARLVLQRSAVDLLPEVIDEV